METVKERDLDDIVEGKASRKGNKKKQKKSVWKRILKVILVLFIIGVATLAFLLYGPYHGFRDWLITSSMTTMTHQWIAELFYSDETIEEVMSRNKVEEVKEDTDISAINTKNE